MLSSVCWHGWHSPPSLFVFCGFNTSTVTRNALAVTLHWLNQCSVHPFLYIKTACFEKRSELISASLTAHARTCKTLVQLVEKGSAHTQTRGVPSSGDHAQVSSGWICNGKDLMSASCANERDKGVNCLELTGATKLMAGRARWHPRVPQERSNQESEPRLCRSAFVFSEIILNPCS